MNIEIGMKNSVENFNISYLDQVLLASGANSGKNDVMVLAAASVALQHAC
jgi:hypothetical protein